MSHEIERIIRAAGAGAWFIEPTKAEEIIAMVALRASMGPRDGKAFPEREAASMSEDARSGGKVVRVLRLHGAIIPRGNMLSDMSGAVSMDRFQQVFRAAASDSSVGAIVLDIDSPGGNVAMVPETVKMIRDARSASRPIVAVANTLCCSAAYWIGTAADELAVTPSGTVGSIGVYMVHQDLSERLKAEGVKVTVLSEGPRKIEGNPFTPLDEVAQAALMSGVRETYKTFTADVAKSRGVPVSVVRADPEAAERHFGGGRSYGAERAVKLGMADRVATLDETITRLARGGRGGVGRRATDFERERLALL